MVYPYISYMVRTLITLQLGVVFFAVIGSVEIGYVVLAGVIYTAMFTMFTETHADALRNGAESRNHRVIPSPSIVGPVIASPIPSMLPRCYLTTMSTLCYFSELYLSHIYSVYLPRRSFTQCSRLKAHMLFGLKCSGKKWTYQTLYYPYLFGNGDVVLWIVR